MYRQTHKCEYEHIATISASKDCTFVFCSCTANPDWAQLEAAQKLACVHPDGTSEPACWDPLPIAVLLSYLSHMRYRLRGVASIIANQPRRG